MLTPRNDDPNFVGETLRKAKDPISFGAAHDEEIKARLSAKAVAEKVAKAEKLDISASLKQINDLIAADKKKGGE